MALIPTLRRATFAAALALVQRRLKHLGITKALQRAGARDGDTVIIGKLSFDFSPDS